MSFMELFNWLHRFRRDHAHDGVREFKEMQAALSVAGQRSAAPQVVAAEPEAGPESPLLTADSATERNPDPPAV
jgi:hypothetical protein